MHQSEQSCSNDQLIFDSHQYAADMRKRLDAENFKGDFLQDIHLDYHHPLEDYLKKGWMLKLLDWLVKPRWDKKYTRMEEIIQSYKNPQSPITQKILYAPLHKFIDRMRGETSAEEFRKRISEQGCVVRGLVLAARSVLKYGLQTPQRFSYPLFTVWNFTNRCNLKCNHCYQTAGKRLDNELTLSEKLRVVDQLGRAYLPMIAFAGGEPTITPELIPVLRRCTEWQMHTSLATNGALFTPKLAEKLAWAGLKYCEVSLDSVRAEKHNNFRGIPGAWERTVEGMKIITSTPGLRLGVAMCVHQDNYDEVPEMLEFAQNIGASCFAYFNFIPVGRGKGMVEQDITPQQREALLKRLNEVIQNGQIGIISTCPQFGRVCLANSPIYVGKVAATHCGSGSGVKARVIAKYLGGCGAGRTYACLQPNGDVTPCVYMPSRVIGNIREKTMQEIIDASPLWNLLNNRNDRWGHCKSCAFRYYCGGCRARADAYYDDPAGPDPGCIFNQSEWNKLLEKSSVICQ
jgi:radical SAM protein with 4Fe4S-binding SPASM domain